eukprot:CAMPEP_0206488074 /NCGR_PEP_ID=MMETSP0324_2-20121206/42127_1 /ASSEMBLY_ACC=CAM_ASM_000836 /TAXON_ID=2866 /ORGANISM="Crypthecodinium cohnii, Strain Seligo" /LENGTH=140 /DNA_ID=CAMNT_0053966891 /DNA_START=282 /DNA_END=704 /DNA_ORIENTATION=+
MHHLLDEPLHQLSQRQGLPRRCSGGALVGISVWGEPTADRRWRFVARRLHFRSDARGLRGPLRRPPGRGGARGGAVGGDRRGAGLHGITSGRLVEVASVPHRLPKVFVRVPIRHYHQVPTSLSLHFIPRVRGATAASVGH